MGLLSNEEVSPCSPLLSNQPRSSESDADHPITSAPPHRQFFKELKELFASSKDSGTVFLVQKRYTYDDGEGDTPMPSSSSSSDATYPCLIRATDGSKDLKISTLVQRSSLASFHTTYSSILRASITSLRPKRKTKALPGGKKKKDAAGGTAGVKELKGLGTAKIVGPRRGAGVKKRRRLVFKRVKVMERLKAREEEKKKLEKEEGKL